MNARPASLVALILLLLGVTSCKTTSSEAQAATESTPPAADAQAPASEPQQQAIERARRALVDQGVRAETLRAESVTPAEWPDSGLGCGQPGVSYLQVITPGYVVKFAGDAAAHEVHVAGEAAVVCSNRVSGTPRRPRSALPARNLDVMVTQARQDLAAKLGVETSAVQVRDVLPAQWPQGSLGCDDSATSAAGVKTPGYRLLLTHAGRVYTYHTDLSTVAACPPIESR